MASEATWQTGSANQAGDREASLSEAAMDQRSIESLLRWLVDQIEDSERRYSEALDQLQARLDHLSQTTGAAQVEASVEEAETLARLHSEVSRLANKLEQSELPEPHFDEFAEIGKVLSEQQASPLGAAESLATGTPSLAEPLSPSAGASEFDSATSEQDRGPEAPAFEAPHLAPDDADLDKRLVAMAHRLEQSIDTAMPATAIDALNAKMDEIAARFESALSETPKRDHLNRLERQISDMGQELGRAKREVARISGIEDQLLRLIEHCEATPPEIEQVASKAANEAVRLVSDAGKTNAAERLDVIHRDLTAMNEQSQATGDRLADTLAAVHESLKQLVAQVERGPQSPPSPPRPPAPRRATPTLLAEPNSDKRPSRNNSDEASQSKQRSLCDTLGIPNLENGAAAASSERGWRSRLPEAAVAEHEPVPSTPELVAAARRAAQAAAGQAEDRGGRAWSGETAAAARASAAAQIEPQARRKRPVLIIVAALLLVISAMLLYSRLELKPEPAPAPQATEQSSGGQNRPASAGEPSDEGPALTLPDTATPPRTGPHGIELPGKNGEFDTILPPVRVGEATGADMPRALTVVPKSLRAHPAAAAEPEAAPAPRPAALRPPEEPALPAGVSLSIQEPTGA